MLLFTRPRRAFRRLPFAKLLSRLHSDVRQDESGQSLIEFALTLPVLLLVVTGMLVFGIAINNYLNLTDATNVGARALSINRGATDPCQVVSSAVSAAAPTLKSSGTTGLTYVTTIAGTTYGGTSCTGAASALSNAQGTSVTVFVTYPCTLRFYNFNKITNCNLQAATTEMVQ